MRKFACLGLSFIKSCGSKLRSWDRSLNYLKLWWACPVWANYSESPNPELFKTSVGPVSGQFVQD